MIEVDRDGALLAGCISLSSLTNEWDGSDGGLRTPQDSMERRLDQSKCSGAASHTLKRLRTIVLTKLEKLNNSYYFQNGVLYKDKLIELI